MFRIGTNIIVMDFLISILSSGVEVLKWDGRVENSTSLGSNPLIILPS